LLFQLATKREPTGRLTRSFHWSPYRMGAR